VGGTTDVDAADTEGATEVATEVATVDAEESLMGSDLGALALTSFDWAFFSLNTQFWILIPTD